MMEAQSRIGRSRLETVTNFAVFVAAIFVAAYFARLFLGGTQSPEAAIGPQIGVRLAPFDGYDWSSHQRTLILALRTDCVYCEASMPFYKRLAVIASERRETHGLISAFPEMRADVDQLLSRVGLQIPSVTNTALATLGVHGTPTLILVDNSGTVLQTWVGRLPPAGEDDVMKAFQITIGS